VLCITSVKSIFPQQNMQMKPITKMELHKYSSYSSQLYFSADSINTLRLQLPDGSHREITHPKLSRDFVSGVLEDSVSQGFFRKSQLTSVEFYKDESQDLPQLVFTRKTVGEQLLDIEFPSLLRLGYREAVVPSQKVTAIGLFRGFLVTDYYLNPSIPLAALGVIEQQCG
jgi:hypothetical protein